MNWFNKQVLGDTRLGLLQEHPVAYFSAEFALSQKLPIYSGGLGVLAGDAVRESADLGIPFVGMGLFYKRGYFTQKIGNSGQKEKYSVIDPQKAELQLVKKNDKPLIVGVPLAEREVFVQVWKYSVKQVSVYLLDCDIAQNTTKDREITENLYGGDTQMRIKQEIILGIGGERALFAMGIHPWVYHMNEGHSAFAILEITHHVMGEKQIDFDAAFALAQDKMVFTNHTLVSAGNDIFETDVIKKYLGSYASYLGLSIEQIIKKGKIAHQDRFAMTLFAARQSCRINAVSKLHEKMAKKLWPELNMFGITNGVHLPTWIAKDIQKLDVNDVSSEDLWKAHEKQRRRLVDFVKGRTGAFFNTKALTVVWARRFAAYKRPDLLFSEIDTLKKIAMSAHGALQIIIAGKAHPKDENGKGVIQRIVGAIYKEKLSDWIVFLPNYDMEAASYLVTGADVWLNTPIRGKEASGTSGMKAGANGVLQCSVCDGWFDEVCNLSFGWKLDSEDTAKSLYATLEREILPLFYERDEHGVPRQWVLKMKSTMGNIWKNYSATRMVKEYFHKLYVPALNQFRENYHKKT